MSLATYVLDRCIPEPNSGCWLWLLSTGSHGYGNACDPERGLPGNVTTAHRLSYRAFVGPIPHGHQIDHKCRTSLCCNPDHLEAVTQRENIRRQRPKGFASKRGAH